VPRTNPKSMDKMSKFKGTVIEYLGFYKPPDIFIIDHEMAITCGFIKNNLEYYVRVMCSSNFLLWNILVGQYADVIHMPGNWFNSTQDKIVQLICECLKLYEQSYGKVLKC